MNINLFHPAISFKVAIWTVTFLSTVIIGFHFLVLLQIIPYEIVWAGKLQTVNEMYVYESISIIVNVLLVVLVLVRGRMINPAISPRIVKSLLWIFVFIFLLNTLGNLASKTSLETMIATLLTFLLAILCLRIVTATTVNKIH